jgi:GT2 family glycosyltransferase
VQIQVVIPTLDARARLLDCLESLDRQTVPAAVTVVDNASSDGTAEAVAERHPGVRLLRNERNLGFGAAINRAALALEGDVLVLVNNDVVCEPDFLERLVAPLERPEVGLVAGVLVQAAHPGRVDSAGIELDVTLRSWDLLWNRPLAELARVPAPVGPCGGAAAYRLPAFRELGGFDEALFAYWEDVDLALRFRAAGWAAASAPDARALHAHGQTLGAASPAARRLDAFGRGYLLGKYRVARGRPLTAARVAALDWPALLVHLLVRRESAPIRERRRGVRLGRAAAPQRPPFELATVSFSEALRRQAAQLQLRATGSLPEHFTAAPAPTADTPAARR